MRSSVTLASISFVLALAGCSTHDADVAAIRADEAQWVKDYNSRDQERIASHYAPDAVIMNPGGPPVHGRDAARKPQAPDPNFSLTMEPERIEVVGSIGYAHGPYSMTRTDRHTAQKMIEKGSFLTVYRKQPDGTWKASADMATVETLHIY
jgi:ketosteroid isomerase-like protein